MVGGSSNVEGMMEARYSSGVIPKLGPILVGISSSRVDILHMLSTSISAPDEISVYA